MACYSGSCNDGNLVGWLVYTIQDRIKQMGIQAHVQENHVQERHQRKQGCINAFKWQETWRSSCNKILELKLCFYYSVFYHRGEIAVRDLHHKLDMHA